MGNPFSNTLFYSLEMFAVHLASALTKRGSMGKSSSPVQWLDTTVQELPFQFSISISISFTISISYQLQVIRRVICRVILRVTSGHLPAAADSKTSPRNPVMCSDLSTLNH